MKNIFAALSKFQSECGPALLDESNPHFRSRFASIASLTETIRPILAKHELTVLQFPISRDDRAGVRTIIGHSSGESLEEEFLIPMGAKQDPQKAIGAVSYARRACLSGALGLITSESIDQDGEDLVGRGSSVAPKSEWKAPSPASKPTFEEVRKEKWNTFVGLFETKDDWTSAWESFSSSHPPIEKCEDLDVL